MEPHPSDAELAAAVGMPGKKIKRLRGGPYLWQFEVGGRAAEVLVLDGKVAPKGLDSVARYLRAIRMLDAQQMKIAELVILLLTYGDVPSDFDSYPIHERRGPNGELAELRYHHGVATLMLYAIEPEPPRQPLTLPNGFPLPTGIVGARAPVWLRATLEVTREQPLAWIIDEREFRDGVYHWVPRAP